MRAVWTRIRHQVSLHRPLQTGDLQNKPTTEQTETTSNNPVIWHCRISRTSWKLTSSDRPFLFLLYSAHSRATLNWTSCYGAQEINTLLLLLLLLLLQTVNIHCQHYWWPVLVVGSARIKLRCTCCLQCESENCTVLFLQLSSSDQALFW